MPFHTTFSKASPTTSQEEAPLITGVVLWAQSGQGGGSQLLSNCPEWRKDYHPFDDHWVAMTIVAGDLSKHCDLNVYTGSIRIGGRRVGPMVYCSRVFQ